MPGAVGPHGQSQLNCFDHVKMGSGMGRAVGVGPGLAAGGGGGAASGKPQVVQRGEHLWHTRSHRDGHPTLVRAVAAHDSDPFPPLLAHVL